VLQLVRFPLQNVILRDLCDGHARTGRGDGGTVVAQAFFKFIDLFIPDTARKDWSQLGQHRAFVFTHLCGPLLGQSITLFLYLADASHGLSFWVIAAGITAFWIYPLALRLFGNLPLVAFFSMEHLTFITLYGSYHYGGVSSPFLPWLLVALLLGFFYLSRHPKIVLATFALNVLGFCVVYYLNGDFPEHVPLEDLSSVGLISVLSATVYMSWMGIYYATVLSEHSEWRREAERHRNTEAQLRVAKEIAEEANRARSVFLAKMSHELRTPLNAVIGYSEMLVEEAEDGSCSDQKLDDLRRINAAGKHLLSLVTDVLDLSKIETNDLSIDIHSFDLQTFINDVIATAGALVTRRGNTLVVDAAHAHGAIVTDGTKLRQVIINLLSNAGKFTSNGVVTLGVSREAKAGDWLEIRVRDTGIGIAKSDLPKLFKKFGQIKTTKQQLQQGTGLGLALCQTLCAKMEGGISVESEEGRGSCFLVRIPADLRRHLAAREVRETFDIDYPEPALAS
jgi:signal transduction histidine kinase